MRRRLGSRLIDLRRHRGYKYGDVAEYYAYNKGYYEN